MNKNLNTVRKQFSVVNHTFASAMKAFLFVACILFSLSLFSQYSITGVVLENQQPLAGATIYHTPSKTGILTNSNGTFILSVPQKPKTIVVSFIGFEPQVIPVRFNDAFTADLGNITLVPDAALEEVVVSGCLLYTSPSPRD